MQLLDLVMDDLATLEPGPYLMQPLPHTHHTPITRVPPHPPAEDILEPAGALEQAHALLAGEIVQGTVQRAVGEQVREGLLARGARRVLPMQAPLQRREETVSAIDKQVSTKRR